MDPNWKYFGYDINRLRQDLSGESVAVQHVPGYTVTYSSYWNQGKPYDEQSAPPMLLEDAQTPGPDSDAAERLDIDQINDQIMGEQPGTTSDRATQWWNVEAMLFFVQNELFNQTSSLEAEWESPAAKEAYLMKVGETLAHIEMWREAAEANHLGLSLLAGAMRTAQTDMKDLWKRYKEAMWQATDDYLNAPPAGSPYATSGPLAGLKGDARTAVRQSVLDRYDLPFMKEQREKYNEEARQLISDTANSYSDAISKLESARANRMAPMNAILHPEATGMPLPPMPPGGGPTPPGGGPTSFSGPTPAPPGGTPAAPAFNGAPPPPMFGGAQPPGGAPRAPGARPPAAPTLAPRTPPPTPVVNPPNAPTRGPAAAPPGAPAVAPPVAPGASGLRQLGAAPLAPGFGAGPTPGGKGLGVPPTLGASSPGGSPPVPPGGGLPGGAPPPKGAMPGKVMPPPAGGVPQKPKQQGKVLGNKDRVPPVPGMGQPGSVPPPPASAPPGRQNNKPGVPMAGLPPMLESQDVFRPPPPPSAPVLDTNRNTKKRAKAQAAAAAAERDRLPSIPGAIPPVLSGARVEPKSKAAAKKQRKRPATEGAVPAEFMAGIDTGTAPVFEGRLAEPQVLNGQEPLGDVPIALRGPAAATLAEHQRHGVPQADRTTRSVLRSNTGGASQQEQRTPDSWDVDTPGGPVVSSAKRDEYRAEPKKALGSKQ
ncbi:hypothetical protein ABZ639_24410 [Saccharomonospora sp. NPDC006951]